MKTVKNLLNLIIPLKSFKKAFFIVFELIINLMFPIINIMLTAKAARIKAFRGSLNLLKKLLGEIALEKKQRGMVKKEFIFEEKILLSMKATLFVAFAFTKKIVFEEFNFLSFCFIHLNRFTDTLKVSVPNMLSRQESEVRTA